MSGKRYRVMGLLHLGELPPTPTEGVVQRAALYRPTECDKCGSREVFDDILEPRRWYCYCCGADGFVVRFNGNGH